MAPVSESDTMVAQLRQGVPTKFCGHLRRPVILYATQNRRVVVVWVKRSATSGRALRRATVSTLEAVTAFQVILYSRPGWPHDPP